MLDTVYNEYFDLIEATENAENFCKLLVKEEELNGIIDYLQILVERTHLNFIRGMDTNEKYNFYSELLNEYKLQLQNLKGLLA